MIKTLIVDDHPLFREGLKAALEATGDFGPILQASSLHETQLILDGALDARVDLVVLDINLPDGSSMDLLEKYSGKIGLPRFCMLSMHADKSFILRSLQAGANGYASKQINLEALILGLKLVALDQLFIESELLRDLLTPIKNRTSEQEAARKQIDALSAREQESLTLLAQGKNAKEIAVKLGISVRTAENYQSGLFAKLGLNSAVDLVRLAQAAGILDL